MRILGLGSGSFRTLLRPEAPARELLLIDWLNSLVYEMATRRMLFGRHSMAIHGHRLHASAWRAWFAQCVVDV